MAGERIIKPEFRLELEGTRYPFAASATLTNGTQTMLEGTWLDAVFYVIGGQARMFIPQVDVTHDTVTLYVGDAVNPQRASGSFSLLAPPDQVAFTDPLGRPAGVMISESARLGLFSTWGVGSFRFSVAATELAATVCVPTPQAGVRGIQLDDGSLLFGDVWLVGGDGVVLRHESVTSLDPLSGLPEVCEAIRVDVVGDPLFRRRLCVPANLFQTPRFLKTITFTDARHSVTCVPDEFGDIKCTVNNTLAPQTVLRIRQTAQGNLVEVVGSVNQSVQ